MVYAGDRSAAAPTRTDRPDRRPSDGERGPVDWWHHAACKGHDLAVFFPREREYAQLARHICGGCPVRGPCLAEALRHERGAKKGDRTGIWGGLTGHERHRLAAAREFGADEPMERTDAQP
jgi:hypothetical protein